jgi:hypothetical protein
VLIVAAKQSHHEGHEEHEEVSKCVFTIRRGLCALRNYLKMAQTSLIVIPAKAGIQVFRGVLDPGFSRGDGVSEF